MKDIKVNKFFDTINTDLFKETPRSEFVIFANKTSILKIIEEENLNYSKSIETRLSLSKKHDGYCLTVYGIKIKYYNNGRTKRK